MALDPDAIRAHEAFDRPWYYSLELASGLYTPGRLHSNVALTRELLSRVDVEGGGANGGAARTLDIGCQEGMVTLLLERRGAAKPLAYDRFLKRSHFDLIREALDTRFDLIGDVKLADLPAALEERDQGPFDLVVFSGVLYHMFDPLGGIANARGLVRNGGIMLIETAASFDDDMTMHFNSGGRFAPNMLWRVSLPCLEYLLRFSQLEPLDVVSIDKPPLEGPGAGGPHGRVAIACRAVEEPVATAEDEWMASRKLDRDFAEFLDWDAVASDEPPVAYREPDRNLVRREDGILDVYASVRATPQYAADDEQMRLDLDATA